MKLKKNIYLVSAAPEEFENRGFRLKTHQMFSVHTTLEEFKNATINGHFGFVFGKTRPGEYHEHCNVIVFEKFRFLKCFSSTLKRKSAFSNSCLKRLFSKSSVFRTGLSLVSTVGLIVEKPPFHLRRSVEASEIREFKKLRRRRRGERQLKNEFIFYLRISRHSEVIYFVFHCQN